MTTENKQNIKTERKQRNNKETVANQINKTTT